MEQAATDELPGLVTEINRKDDAQPFIDTTASINHTFMVLFAVFRQPEKYFNIWRMLVQACLGWSICGVCGERMHYPEENFCFFACKKCTDKDGRIDAELTEAKKCHECPGNWTTVLMTYSQTRSHVAFDISPLVQYIVKELMRCKAPVPPCTTVPNVTIPCLSKWGAPPDIINTMYGMIEVRELARPVPFALQVLSHVSFQGLSLNDSLEQLNHLLETQRNCNRVAFLCKYLGLLDESNPPYLASVHVDGHEMYNETPTFTYLICKPWTVECANEEGLYKSQENMFQTMDDAQFLTLIADAKHRMSGTSRSAVEENIRKAMHEMRMDDKTVKDAVLAFDWWCAYVMSTCTQHWLLHFVHNVMLR